MERDKKKTEETENFHYKYMYCHLEVVLCVGREQSIYFSIKKINRAIYINDDKDNDLNLTITYLCVLAF